MSTWLKEKIFRAIVSVGWMIFIISMGIRTILRGRKKDSVNLMDEHS